MRWCDSVCVRWSDTVIPESALLELEWEVAAVLPF